NFVTLLRVGQLAMVEVVASTDGFLDAWIDFGRDGSWAENGDQIFTNGVVTAGTNLLSFLVPATASSGNTFGRFRFSTAGGLAFVGAAADGEVEDYAVTITPTTDLSVVGFGAPDPVGVGSNLTYTLIVSNAGPSTATGTALSNTLPASVALVSATSS